MQVIENIRKLSLWIFILPFVAINFCLLISINYEFLDGTIFSVDQLGRSNFVIPYIDGSLSISRASRTFPQYLIFKPSMIICAIMLYFYWQNNNKLVNSFYETKNINYKFKMFGILSAVFLVIHSIFLGIKFDIQIYKLFRRVVLLLFIIFEIIAQGILVYNFFKLKEKIKNLFNYKILKCKILLVSTLSVIGLLSIPLLVTKGNTHIKHALEWNFFLGVILFYLLTRFLWRRTT